MHPGSIEFQPPSDEQIKQWIREAVEQHLAERTFLVRGEYANQTMVFPHLVHPGEERTAEQFNDNFAALAAWTELLVRGAIEEARKDLGLDD